MQDPGRDLGAPFAFAENLEMNGCSIWLQLDRYVLWYGIAHGDRTQPQNIADVPDFASGRRFRRLARELQISDSRQRRNARDPMVADEEIPKVECFPEELAREGRLVAVDQRVDAGAARHAHSATKPMPPVGEGVRRKRNPAPAAAVTGRPPFAE